jgi:hypothetical protein
MTDPIVETVNPKARCEQIVYVPDQLRYTGRGRSGFEMHYNRRRCKRTATSGSYCWQHRMAHLAREAGLEEGNPDERP